MIRLLVTIFFSTVSFAAISQQKIGIASYYHSKFEGRKTASGDIFSNKKMTAASNYYKLGEWVKVTNAVNGKSVLVQINDRMAKGNKRLIDLSYEAARQLCFVENGVCKVKIEKTTNTSEDNNSPVEIVTDTTALKE